MSRRAFAINSRAVADALMTLAPAALALPEFVAVRHATRQALPFTRVARGSLGIGQRIGLAALSSGAVRLRMYGRSGIGIEKVARIVLFAAMTVALGFTTLIAAGPTFNHALVTSVLEIERGYTHTLAAALPSVPAVYLSLCFRRREPLAVGRFRLPLPHPAIAAAQIALGCTNLLLKAAILAVCINLFTQTDDLTVASLYVPGEDAAAGLLVFRVIYYLAPLLLGLGVFVGDEIRRRRQGNDQPRPDDTSESPRLRYVPHVSHR